MIKLGLCGAHRTGKTTLAKELAKVLELPFVATDSGAVFKQYGLKADDNIDIATRILIQDAILDAGEQCWKEAGEYFITDRTPMDMLAYTLADIQGDTTCNIHLLEQYSHRCFHLCEQYFTKLSIVQPGIPLVYEEGKAALNIAYIEHLNVLIQGLCADERMTKPVLYLSRNCVDLSLRVSAISEQLFIDDFAK